VVLASENDRASVMDYPHPYVTLKFGQLDLSQAYDIGIGEWDKYVVEYGYQDFDDSFDEQESLLALVDKAKEAGFLYKSDPDARTPSRVSADGHLWDNGAELQNAVPVAADIQHEALELMLKSASAEYLSLPESLMSLIPPKAYGSSRTRESMGSRMVCSEN